jgi:pimeloyl-ACP methyl ester carboxylesterase
MTLPFAILMAAQALTGKLTPCNPPRMTEEGALCGKYDVLEDRSLPAGRKISLNIVVLPATGDSALLDPLVFLAGGGVVPATEAGAFLARAMPQLREHRDIVLVDQRGTGQSNPLHCDRSAMASGEGTPADRYLRMITMCRAALAAKADVRMYTTEPAMADLDEVRAWLGYPAINIFAASYGTSAAQVYLRRYPARVRTMVLHGVVPLDVPMPLDLARSAERVLERVLSAEDRRIVNQLGSNPDVSEAVVGSLASITTIQQLPTLIQQLAQGGTPPPPGGRPAPPPLGVRLAILCSEGMPMVDTSRIAAATAGTFLGDAQVRFQLRWCEDWPRGELTPGFHESVSSDVPALLITGELDPTTPPMYAERVARTLSLARVITLPNRSHNDLDPCLLGMVEAFVISRGRGMGFGACE